MKYINKILSLFVIALIATSCDPDAESYTLGELEDGNQGICFAGNYTQTVEVEPGITSFDLTLTRALTDAAGTVDVTVINNEKNIFVCPSTVSFAAGEKTAKLTVEAPSAAEGITYNLQLALSGNDVSNYSSGYHEISVNFAILKWEIENILDNTDFMILLSQAQSDRTILAKQLGISEHQLSYITHSNSGEGLLFYGNVTIPFVDRFPRGEIYDLLTTRPEDMKNETKNE